METQNVQEQIVEDNKLKGGLTVDNALALAGGAVKPEDIEAEQAAEEAKIHADIAAKKGISTPASAPQTPAVTEPPVDTAPQAEAPAAQPAPAQPPEVTPQAVKPADYFGVETPEAPAADEVDHSGKTVPVEEHVKLRKRAQDAEAELARIRETQTAGVSAGELGDLQIDDDVAIEGRVAKQLVAKELAKQEREILGKVGDILSQRDAQIAAAIAAQTGKNRLAKSQATVRANLPDFDAVVQKAVESGVIDLQEAVAEARPKKNPALELYFAAKQRLALAGIQVAAPQSAATQKPSTKQTPAKPPEQTTVAGDEELGEAGEVITPDAVKSAPELFKSTFAAPKTNKTRAT